MPNYKKITVLIIGKIPPPYMGTSVWFKTLMDTPWPKSFEMIWFNNNIHKSLNSLSNINVINILKNIRLYFSYNKVFKANNPDVILIPISQETKGFIKDSFYIKYSKTRSNTLVILHGSNIANWLTKSSIFTKKYVASTLQNIDGIIVLGNKLKKLFKNIVPAVKVFIVQNGVKIPPITNYQHKHNTDKIIIRYLGNLQSNKGITKIIDSLKFINNNNYELRVTGEWRDKSTKRYCIKTVNDNKLPVVFEGPKYGENKYYCLLDSDIFIFVSTQPEGQPLVLLEAMSAGLPIISVDKGAISETVIHNENGIILENNQPQLIADKLMFLINNKSIRDKMGIKSRERFINHYTNDKMVSNFCHLFNNITQSK